MELWVLKYFLVAAREENITKAAALLHAEVPADEIADMIHAHPTYSEAFMEACAAALGRCIHLPAGQP